MTPTTIPSERAYYDNYVSTYNTGKLCFLTYKQDTSVVWLEYSSFLLSWSLAAIKQGLHKIYFLDLLRSSYKCPMFELLDYELVNLSGAFSISCVVCTCHCSFRRSAQLQRSLAINAALFKMLYRQYWCWLEVLISVGL